MATSNFTVTGTTPATAEAISGLTDGNSYEVQNRLNGTLYVLTRAAADGQPTSAITPKSVARGGSFFIDADSTESYWVWHTSATQDGQLVIEDLGET